MSVAVGPDVIEDGLAYCIDPSDLNSYPGSGTSVYDLIDPSRSATLNNGPIFSSDNHGKFILDSTNDTISYNYGAPSGYIEDNFTYDLWYKPTTTKYNVYRIAGLAYVGNYDGGFVHYFEPQTDIWTMATDSNNKIYIAGEFEGFGDNKSRGIIRLNADGTYDSSFNVGTGFDAIPLKILPTSNNKIYAVGYFTSYNGNSVNRLVRLNNDGSIDTSFSTSNTLNREINDIVEDSSGNVYAGGSFYQVNGAWQFYLAKFDSDGNLTSDFNNNIGYQTINNRVTTMALVNNEETLIIGGYFTTVHGSTHNRIVALSTASGTIDSNYDFGTGFNDAVFRIKENNDGFYAGGAFTTYQGNAENRIVRLDLSDCSVDTNFDVGTGFNNIVYDFDLDSSGNVFVGGGFTSFNGSTCNRIAKVNSLGILQSAFNYQSQAVFSVKVDENSGNVFYGGIFVVTLNNDRYNGFDARSLSDGSTNSTFLTNIGQPDHLITIRVMWQIRNKTTNAAGQLSFYPYGYASLGYDESVAAGLIDKWNNLTIVGSGINLKMYVDGTKKLDYDFSNYYMKLGVGSYYTGSNVGSIKIYTRSLSDEEIQQNYHATKGRFGL